MVSAHVSFCILPAASHVGYSAGANEPALQGKVMHITFGKTPDGWVVGRSYDFSFTMTEHTLQIFVSDNGATPVEVFNIHDGPFDPLDPSSIGVGPIMGSRPWP